MTPELQEIITLLIEQATIWAPSVTAVLAIVVTLCTSLSKIKKTLSEVKDSNKEVRATNDFKALHTDLKQAHTDNKELKELINTFIDKATGIEGYTAIKEKEHEERKN